LQQRLQFQHARRKEHQLTKMTEGEQRTQRGRQGQESACCATMPEQCSKGVHAREVRQDVLIGMRKQRGVGGRKAGRRGWRGLSRDRNRGSGSDGCSGRGRTHTTAGRRRKKVGVREESAAPILRDR
jgi:hypothetical protein